MRRKKERKEKPYESADEDRHSTGWNSNLKMHSSCRPATRNRSYAAVDVCQMLHSLFLSHRNSIATMRDSFHVCVPNWACTIYTNAHRMIHSKGSNIENTSPEKRWVPFNEDFLLGIWKSQKLHFICPIASFSLISVCSRVCWENTTIIETISENERIRKISLIVKMGSNC